MAQSSISPGCCQEILHKVISWVLYTDSLPYMFQAGTGRHPSSRSSRGGITIDSYGLFEYHDRGSWELSFLTESMRLTEGAADGFLTKDNLKGSCIALG